MEKQKGDSFFPVEIGSNIPRFPGMHDNIKCCVLAFVLVNRVYSVSPVYGKSPRFSSKFQYTMLGKGGKIC